MDFRVYIANLGKYNEGEQIGAWFIPPIEFEEVAERIGLNASYEEYAIHDYENCPIKISEYTDIEEVNTIAEQLEALYNCGFDYEDVSEFMKYFSDLEELMDNKNDIIIYSNCSDMMDVVYYYLEEFELSKEMLIQYFDYEKFARDLEVGNNFIIGKNCVFGIFN